MFAQNWPCSSESPAGRWDTAVATPYFVTVQFHSTENQEGKSKH